MVFPTFFNLSLNLAKGVHDLSHSQLPGLFLLTVSNFSIFSCKEYNQSDFGIDHLDKTQFPPQSISPIRKIFLLLNSYFIVWIYQNMFTSDWTFGLFLFLAIINNTLITWCRVTHWKRPWFGEIKARRRSGQQRLDSITDSIDINLSKLREIVKNREAWSAKAHGVLTEFSNWMTTKLNPGYHISFKQLIS